MRTVLAFDQATRTSGFSVYQNGILKKVGKFTYTESDIAERLTRIRNKVISLVGEYKPTEVVIEEIQLQDNVVTFKKLAMVYGVILQTCSELELPYTILSSNTWKSKCGIRKQGREKEKAAAKEFVKKQYGIIVTEDEADAICIGYTHTHTKPDYDWSN